MPSLGRLSPGFFVAIWMLMGCGPIAGGEAGSSTTSTTTSTSTTPSTTGTGGLTGSGGTTTAGTGGVTETTTSGGTGGTTETTTASGGTGGVTETTASGGTGGITGTTTASGGTGGITGTTTASGGTGGITGTTTASGGTGGITDTTSSTSGTGGVTGTTTSTTTSTGPTCGAPEIDCSGACVNPLSDTQNCGACGVACAPGALCVNGACGIVCPPGKLLCNNACIDPNTSPQNCGGCGIVCLLGKVCTAGACVPACGPGQVLCNGACVTLDTDPASCGACGNTCAAGLSCVEGSCGCPAGEVLCGGACVDPESDPSYCGASDTCQGAFAGAACAAGQVCVAGACAGACAAGKTACGGTCYDLAITNDHCGACNTACPPGSACLGGTCSGTGPLYAMSNSSFAYTMDRTTGQATQLPGFIQGFGHSLAFDRKNGHFYIGGPGTVRVANQTLGGQFDSYWGGSAYEIAHDSDQDVFFVSGYIGTYALRKWNVLGAQLGQVSLPGPTIAALTFDPHHHRLYALAATFLYSYDIATDVWTVVADTGIDWGDPGGQTYSSSLAYDPSSEVLYVTHWPTFALMPGMIWPTFRRMDPKTGATTVISNLSVWGPIGLALTPDGSQCLPLGGPCGVFATCGPYQVCATKWPPPEDPHCVSVASCPGYCGSCACLGGACTTGTSCVSAGNTYMDCQ